MTVKARTSTSQFYAEYAQTKTTEGRTLSTRTRHLHLPAVPQCGSKSLSSVKKSKMFRAASVVRVNAVRVRSTVSKRRLCTAPKREVSKVPTKGQADGGHPDTLQKGVPTKSWLNEPAAWPIIGITIGACLFAAYKLYVVDAKSPDVHFSKKSRGTLDYIENEGDEAAAKKWGEKNLIPGVEKGHHEFKEQK